MSTAGDIADRIARVLPVMVATGDADALWLVEILRTWQGGAEFDAAAGLAGGWRAPSPAAPDNQKLSCHEWHTWIWRTCHLAVGLARY